MQESVSGHLGSRREWRPYVVAALACALGLVLVRAIDIMHVSFLVREVSVGGTTAHRLPVEVYVPIHSVLEFTSIVVSFAVFTVGWYGYRQTKNRQDLFVAVAYMAVGAIDFVHTLSFRGMPDFLGTNTVGKAAAYWLAARLIDGAALLAAAFIMRSGKGGWVKPRLLMPAAMVIVLVLVTLISWKGRAASDLMYVIRDGQGQLTSLKIWLEYFVVGLYVAAFWAFGRMRNWPGESVRLMRTALLIAVGSEICFTLYRSAYDGYNMVGHIYKVASYYFVLQALFVSSLRRPHQELSETKEQLHRSFLRIGDALASGLRKEPTLKLISSLAREMLDADFAAIGEMTARDTIRISTFDGIHPEPFDVPLRDSLSGQTLMSGRPLIVHDLRKHPLARPEFLTLGLRGFLSAPIERDRGPIGAIYVCSRQPGKFTEADAEMLTVFSRQASIALQDAEHYEQEHHIAEALQQVIFPPPRMEYDGYLITGRYQPAWDEARVGGDFYDYFDLGGRRVGLVIGDVSGKGLHAAVHTAIVKYSYQAYLREGFEPAEALRRIDQVFKERVAHEHMPDSAFVTLFCGLLSTDTGRLLYANAGHEPAIKISSNGTVAGYDSTGPILGIGVNVAIEQAEMTIDPGDKLLLVTDGITEARTGSDLFGFDRLMAVVQDCAACHPEQLVQSVYDKAKAHSEENRFKDDVAVVLVSRGS